MVDNCKVLKNKQMYNKEKILDIHPYQITKPKTENGRYQTYVKGDDNKRKIIRDYSLDGLLKKLLDYYTGTSKQSLTMQQLFDEWLEYKTCITDSTNTIRRHEQHWKKYFSDWADKKLTFYDKLELQKQCNLLVKNHNLSSKEWQNVKTILSGMFYYAYEKQFINSNLMSDIKITVKFRQVNKKSGNTETFQTEERKILLTYFDSQYKVSGDSVYLALKLDFYIGLRIGELSTLKWKDIISLKDLHICREEIKKSIREQNKWKDVYEVVDHTKTHNDRIIPLVKSAISLLNQLRLTSEKVDDEDYIFIRNGKRLTSRQITYALEKACKKNNLPVKRTHKIRKTVASTLNSGHVPMDAIREFLGHSSLETTMGYIYNPLSEKETYSLISKAL